jgi:chromosome segregation ATPase
MKESGAICSMSDNDDDNFAVTWEDREQQVLDLFRQGKKRRDIAKICRMSFTDIKKIVDSKYGPKRQNNNLKNEISKYSEALKLFLSGKKPVDVAIKLGLGYEEVRKVYLQFLKLNRMHRLRKIFDELGDNIKPFLSLYDRMQENNFTIEQITDAVNLVDSLPQIEERYHALDTETNALESKRRKLAVSSAMLKSQIDELNRQIEYYRNVSEIKMKELSALNSEINAKKNFIENFDEEGYKRINEAAKNQTELVMQNSRQLLRYAVAATFEAIRRYPANQALYYHLLTAGLNPSYQQSWIESHKTQLIELGEYIQLEMKQLIAKDVISDIQNTGSEPGRGPAKYAH